MVEREFLTDGGPGRMPSEMEAVDTKLICQTNHVARHLRHGIRDPVTRTLACAAMIMDYDLEMRRPGGNLGSPERSHPAESRGRNQGRSFAVNLVEQLAI